MDNKKHLRKRWRKLDNTAKIFSLELESNVNIFRYSIVLKKSVDKIILIKALVWTLKKIYKLLKRYIDKVKVICDVNIDFK